MAYAKLKATWLLRPFDGSTAFAAAATAMPRLLLLSTETYEQNGEAATHSTQATCQSRCN